MRAPALVLLSLVAACHCLQPVEELREDGGAGGGSGGGSAGGAAGGSAGGAAGGAPGDGGCTAASQCPGPGPAMHHCGFAMDAGFSCVDQTCLFECFSGRTCDTRADAGCLTCGAVRACAPGTGCGFSAAASVLSHNGCPAALPMDLQLAPLPGACGWVVTSSTGGDFGTLYRLDDGTLLAHFPSLGGTCTGFSQGQQVERWLLSCPACQLEMLP